MAVSRKHIDHLNRGSAHQLGFGLGRIPTSCPHCGDALGGARACAACGAFACEGCDAVVEMRRGNGRRCWGCA